MPHWALHDLTWSHVKQLAAPNLKETSLIRAKERRTHPLWLSKNLVVVRQEHTPLLDSDYTSPKLKVVLVWVLITTTVFVCYAQANRPLWLLVFSVFEWARREPPMRKAGVALWILPWVDGLSLPTCDRRHGKGWEQHDEETVVMAARVEAGRIQVKNPGTDLEQKQSRAGAARSRKR